MVGPRAFISKQVNTVPRFSYQKRTFLAPPSTSTTSYLLAEIESTRDGEYPWGTNMLTVADCRRSVQIEFFLGTKRSRALSLAKIDLLLSILTRFRAALAKEIALIEKAK